MYILPLKDESTLSNHKALVERLVDLQLEFSSLSFGNTETLAPYFEKTVSFQSKNGYAGFTGKLRAFLTDCVNQGFLVDYIERFVKRNPKIFHQENAEKYIDAPFIKTITRLFENAILQLHQIRRDASVNNEKERTMPYNTLSKYAWLGKTPLNKEKSKTPSVRGIYEEVNDEVISYCTTLLDVSKQRAHEHRVNPKSLDDILGFNLTAKMHELSNNVQDLSVYSNLERYIIARVYTKCVDVNRERTEETRISLKHKLTAIQYLLEKALYGESGITNAYERYYTHQPEQNNGTNLEDKDAQLTHSSHLTALASAKGSMQMHNAYSEILPNKQRDVLALVSDLYKTYAELIYQDPTALSLMGSFQNRIKGYFCNNQHDSGYVDRTTGGSLATHILTPYATPKAGLNNDVSDIADVSDAPTPFPFFIYDGIIEGYLKADIVYAELEEQEGDSTVFPKLTTVDILGVLHNRTKRLVVEQFTSNEFAKQVRGSIDGIGRVLTPNPANDDTDSIDGNEQTLESIKRGVTRRHQHLETLAKENYAERYNRSLHKGYNL